MGRGAGLLLAAAVALSSAGLATPVRAQDTVLAPPNQAVLPRVGILLVDQERLFRASQFGLRVAAQIEAESAALAAENRRLEEELRTEELALTAERPNLSPEAFRDLADDFDARVTQVRATQDRKAAAIGQRQEAERVRFVNAVVPILGGIMQESGAVLIFDRRNVFLSDDRIDITDLAIARINAALGDGTEGLLNATDPTVPEADPEDAPAPAPAPESD